MIPDCNPHAAKNPALQTIFGGAWRLIIPEYNSHAVRKSRTANNLSGERGG